MIELRHHQDGVVLPVRAQPGARKSEIRGEQNGALKVAVTEAAEKGKANQAIVALVCKKLGLRKSQVRIIAGAAARDKKLLVAGMEQVELEGKLKDAAAS